MSSIDPTLLKPNPANRIFDPLADDVYQALKDDIAARGLLNPIVVTPTFKLIAGHHRLKAALELGLETVPIDIQNVDDEEAESRLIADNVLRRQLNPMEQARLIRRLKERAGIRQGTRATSVTVTEVAQAVGVEPETAKQLDRLNKLIPPLQELVSAGKLGTSNGAELAIMTPTQQQALYDAIGESVATLKRADIQAAKRTPDTTALEAQIAALAAERDALQVQLQEAQTAQAPTASLLASLKCQLDEAEATRQAYADELARLKAQTPVERIVEKVVDKIVEKPVPDPAQTQRIAALESTLTTTQAELTLLKTRRKDLQHYQQERDKLEREINVIKDELARLRDSTNVARYRLTQAAGISQILRKILKDGLSEIPQLEALLADSHGTIFQTDRDLALTVAQQLRRASDVILTAVQQFEDPMVFDVRHGSDPDHPITQALKEAKVLNDDDAIISPAD